MESICKCLSVKNSQESKNSIMESDEEIDGTAAHFTLSNSFANGWMILGVFRLKRSFYYPRSRIQISANYKSLQHYITTTTTTALSGLVVAALSASTFFFLSSRISALSSMVRLLRFFLSFSSCVVVLSSLKEGDKQNDRKKRKSYQKTSGFWNGVYNSLADATDAQTWVASAKTGGVAKKSFINRVFIQARLHCTLMKILMN